MELGVWLTRHDHWKFDVTACESAGAKSETLAAWALAGWRYCLSADTRNLNRNLDEDVSTWAPPRPEN